MIVSNRCESERPDRWVVVVFEAGPTAEGPRSHEEVCWRLLNRAEPAVVEAVRSWCIAYPHVQSRIGRPCPALDARQASVADIQAWFARERPGSFLNVHQVSGDVGMLLEEGMPWGELWEVTLIDGDTFDRLGLKADEIADEIRALLGTDDVSGLLAVTA